MRLNKIDYHTIPYHTADESGGVAMTQSQYVLPSSRWAWNDEWSYARHDTDAEGYGMVWYGIVVNHRSLWMSLHHLPMVVG